MRAANQVIVARRERSGFTDVRQAAIVGHVGDLRKRERSARSGQFDGGQRVGVIGIGKNATVENEGVSRRQVKVNIKERRIVDGIEATRVGVNADKTFGVSAQSIDVRYQADFVIEYEIRILANETSRVRSRRAIGCGLRAIDVGDRDAAADEHVGRTDAETADRRSGRVGDGDFVD